MCPNVGDPADGTWAGQVAHQATAAALKVPPRAPQRLLVDATLRLGQAEMKISNAGSGKGHIDQALMEATDKYIKLEVASHLVVAEWYRMRDQKLDARNHWHIACQKADGLASEALSNWIDQVGASISTRLSININGPWKEVLAEFRDRYDYHQYLWSQANQEEFQKRTGLKKERYFKAKKLGRVVK